MCVYIIAGSARARRGLHACQEAVVVVMRVMASIAEGKGSGEDGGMVYRVVLNWYIVQERRDMLIRDGLTTAFPRRRRHRHFFCR